MSETTPDGAARVGADSLRAGVGLMEGVVESGRAAISEFEEGLKGTDSNSAPELQVFLESAVRGYGAFFFEMTRNARQVASEYRSDSGRLVSKPLAADRARDDTPPSSNDQSAELGAPGPEPDPSPSLLDPVDELSGAVETLFDVLRGLVGGSR